MAVWGSGHCTAWRAWALIHQHVEAIGGAIDVSTTDFGYDVGSSVMLFFGRHVGVRGDAPLHPHGVRQSAERSDRVKQGALQLHARVDRSDAAVDRGRAFGVGPPGSGLPLICESLRPDPGGPTLKARPSLPSETDRSPRAYGRTIPSG